MPRAIWNRAVLADSDEYQVVEENIYFPPESVKWEYFKKGDREYNCPWKGEACYHNITVGNKVNENAAWSYTDPKPAARHIKGHVAFETRKGIEVER